MNDVTFQPIELTAVRLALIAKAIEVKALLEEEDALELTDEQLQEMIEDALKANSPEAPEAVQLTPEQITLLKEDYNSAFSCGDTDEAEKLKAKLVALGLDEDGTVPKAAPLSIVDRLRAQQAAAAAAAKAAKKSPKVTAVKAPVRTFDQETFSQEVLTMIAEARGGVSALVLIGKRKVQIAGTDEKFMVLGQRLQAYKKDGDDIILVVHFQGEPWCVQAGKWLDTGPRLTNSWRDLEYYAGGVPTRAFTLKLVKLAEYLEYQEV